MIIYKDVDIGKKRLHLNERGSGRLAVNFMSYMRQYYQLNKYAKPSGDFVKTESRANVVSTYETRSSTQLNRDRKRIFVPKHSQDTFFYHAFFNIKSQCN